MDLDAFPQLEQHAQVYYHNLSVHSISQLQDYFAIWLFNARLNHQLVLDLLHQNAITHLWLDQLKLHALGMLPQPLVFL